MFFLRYIFLYLKGLFFLPHVALLYTVKKQKCVYAEANRALLPTGYSYKNLNALLWLLENDKYYRNFFYYRIGRLSTLVKWYTPGDRSFVISCKTIGEGGYFPHSYSTIINAKSVGKNFICRQCTTIGNKIDGHNDLVPTIGDNVTLGANVVIIGNVSVGNNVIIGAGSVVVHDVPDNSVVVGNPARVIRTLV